MELLRTFPEHPQHVMTVTLNGRRLEYWRTWRPRLGAWYIDIFEDDRPILLGRRLVPGQPLQGSLPADLPGVIFVTGPDDYSKEDLGGDLQEIFIHPDELPEPEEEESFIVDISEVE